MTSFAIAAAFALLVAEPGRPADPPVAKPPATAEPTKDDKTAKAKEEKRPTTPEEFRNLAKEGPRPPWLPFTGGGRVHDERITGTVVAVSREAIEILPEGKKETVKYPPYTLLNTGAVCHWESEANCYLLDDVQKGDHVIIGVGIPERGAEMQCFYVSIRERPGDVIPPSRKPSYPKPYHVWWQKRIDEERKSQPPKAEKDADPPMAKPPEKVVDGGKKDEPKRPTTKEEFAALAKEGPKPPWMPFGRGHKTVLDQLIDGTVVEVSADAIEVRPKGKKETVKFPPHVLLATGAVCHWQSDSTCYLLDDVQKGDVVLVAYGTVDEKKGPECFYIKIRERPGGAVPASRKPSDTKPYHLEREYELYYERRGEKTPEELKTAEEKRQFLLKKGILPPAGAGGDPKKKD